MALAGGQVLDPATGMLTCGQTLWGEMDDAELTQVNQGMGLRDSGLGGNSGPVAQAHVGQPDVPAGK